MRPADVPRVSCERVVDAEAWTDLRAVLRSHIENQIAHDDVVDADAGVDRQSRGRPPGVLNVGGIVPTLLPKRSQLSAVDDLAMKRHERSVG